MEAEREKTSFVRTFFGYLTFLFLVIVFFSVANIAFLFETEDGKFPVLRLFFFVLFCVLFMWPLWLIMLLPS